MLLGASSAEADCLLKDVGSAASSEPTARKIDVSVWITDPGGQVDAVGVSRALAGLSTNGVLFDIVSVDRGSADDAQEQFRNYSGDVFIVLDAQTMIANSPKYNGSLSTFKDEDLTDQSVIIDPLVGLDVKRPRFVQIDAHGNASIVAYRIEATIGLIEFGKLWASQTYKQYVLSTGTNDVTVQLRDARHAVMDECILPAWKPQ